MCDADGCERPVYCKGLCTAHYQRLRKRGSLVLPSEEDLFWRKVDKTDGCWLWTGATDRGYDRVFWKRKNIRATHLSWRFHFGPVPDGAWLLHRCDTPLCVRPDHLFLGDNADNVADKMQKGRQPKGSQQPRARLTEAQVASIRAEWLAGGVRQKELAATYGVGQTTIQHIVEGKTWRHVAWPSAASARAAS